MKITNEHKLYIEFAMGCALKVLPIFEQKYKDDLRPRKAIVAAQTFLDKPTKKNKDAAYAAAAAAAGADEAAYASAYAAAAAADEAAAAYAADAAAYAAYAAADAAYAAYGAYGAAAADERKWQAGLLFVLNIKYGLSIKIRGVA